MKDTEDQKVPSNTEVKGSGASRMTGATASNGTATVTESGTVNVDTHDRAKGMPDKTEVK